MVAEGAGPARDPQAGTRKTTPLDPRSHHRGSLPRGSRSRNQRSPSASREFLNGMGQNSPLPTFGPACICRLVACCCISSQLRIKRLRTEIEPMTGIDPPSRFGPPSKDSFASRTPTKRLVPAGRLTAAQRKHLKLAAYLRVWELGHLCEELLDARSRQNQAQ